MLRIGELSRQVGVSAATIRYYERRGLLRKPARTPSGYRAYPVEAALELRLIRWAKAVGFTLREIRDLLAIVREHAVRPGGLVRSRFAGKLREVETRLQELKAIRDQLVALAACRCRGECPIIAAAVAVDSRPRRSR